MPSILLLRSRAAIIAGKSPTHNEEVGSRGWDDQGLNLAEVARGGATPMRPSRSETSHGRQIAPTASRRGLEPTNGPYPDRLPELIWTGSTDGRLVTPRQAPPGASGGAIVGGRTISPCGKINIGSERSFLPLTRTGRSKGPWKDCPHRVPQPAAAAGLTTAGREVRIDFLLRVPRPLTSPEKLR